MVKSGLLFGLSQYPPASAGAEGVKSPMSLSRRHCERSDAIQSSGKVLDCFVASLFAMTKKRVRKAERRQSHCRQSPRASGARVAPRRKRLAPPSACGRARLPAFHHGSAQGVCSPLVRSGPGFVGRFPLPTSSDAPRTPVVMPAGMMPGPPECAADEAAPAGAALAPCRQASPGRRPYRGEIQFAARM